jgi:hypothetical protein
VKLTLQTALKHVPHPPDVESESEGGLGMPLFISMELAPYLTLDLVLAESPSSKLRYESTGLTYFLDLCPALSSVFFFLICLVLIT